jgi:hypothetical protein
MKRLSIILKLKKTLALMLALIITIGLFPSAVSAEYEQETPDELIGTDSLNGEPMEPEPESEAILSQQSDTTDEDTRIDTQIPDINFLAAIRHTLDRPWGDDKHIKQSEVKDITELDINGWGISDLTGIEYFTSLIALDCSYNLLTKLDLSENKALERLDCSNNRLASLNLSGNPNLRELICNDNRLTALDLSNNRNISKLWCHQNLLPPIPSNAITGFGTLTLLNLDDPEYFSFSPQKVFPTENRNITNSFMCLNFLAVVREITGKQSGPIHEGDVFDINHLFLAGMGINNLAGIEYFTALESLYCWDNNLITLDVSKNTRLKHLAVSFNNLIELDLRNNRQLVSLQVAGNQLTKLDVTGNNLLQSLECDRNQLTQLNLTENKELLQLSFAGNRLESIDLSANTKLEEVIASGNRLTGLNLTNNPSIMILMVDRNQMESEASILGLNGLSLLDRTNEYVYRFEPQNLFIGQDSPITFGCPLFEAAVRFTINKPSGAILRSDVAGVENLRIGHWGITNLTGIEHFTSLLELNASGNRLTSLDLRGNPALRGLICSDNRLTSLNILSNSNLETLIVTQNQLTSLALNDIAPYRYIDVGWNNIPNTNAITGRTGIRWDMEGEDGFIRFFFHPQNTTTLNTPAAPALVVNGPFAVTVSWANVTGASGYELYRKLQSAPVSAFERIQTLPAGTTSWVDRTIDQNTRYSYAVVVDSFDKKSARSPARDMPALGAANRATAPQPTVTGSTAANGISPLNASVTWAASPGTGEDAPIGYEIWRSTVGGAFEKVSGDGLIVGATAAGRVFLDPDVTPGVRYEYRVCAVWARWELSGTQLVDASADSVVRQFTAPALPALANLRAAAHPTNPLTRVSLTWTALRGAAGYDIRRVDDPDNVVYVSGVNLALTGTTLRYDGWNPLDFGAYSFEVRPVWLTSGGSRVEGGYIRVNNVSTQNTAVTPAVAAINPYTVRLRWTPPAQGVAAGYIITRADELTAAPPVVIATVRTMGATEYIDTSGLIPGRLYTYSLQPIWADGGDRLGRESGRVSIRTAMQMPSGLRAAVIRPTSAELTWNRLAGNPTTGIRGPDGYEIFIPGVGTFERTEPNPLAANVSTGAAPNTPMRVAVDNLNPGTTYTAMIRAYWGDGLDRLYGNYSAAISFTPPSPVPGGLARVSATTDSLTIRWNGIANGTNNINTIGFDGYRVYVDGERIGELIHHFGAGVQHTLSFDSSCLAGDAKLTPATVYRVQIVGVWSGKEGTRSNPVNISTDGPAPTWPTPVANARVSVSSTSAVIRWNDVIHSPDGYIIYRDGVRIGDTEGAASTTFTDHYLMPGAAVRYTVQAYWGDKYSDSSTGNMSTALQVTALAGNAPTGVAGINQRPTSIGVVWNDIPGAAGYRIYLGNRLLDPDKDDDVSGISENFTNPRVKRWEITITGLEPIRQHQVRVSAVWDAGEKPATLADIEWENKQIREGRLSSAVNISTTGPAPRNLNLIAASRTPVSVTLIWDEPLNNADNALEIKGWRINKNGIAHTDLPYDGTETEIVNGIARRAWTDNNRKPGAADRYTVQALWGWDETAAPGQKGSLPGSFSNAINVAAMGGVPGGIRAVPNTVLNPNPTATSITVDWFGTADVNGMAVVSYNVYLLLGGDEVQSRLNVPVVQPLLPTTALTATRQGSVSFAGLTPNTLYQVQIEPVWTGGVEGSRGMANIRTANPNTGTPVQASATSTSVTLGWNQLSGAAGYLVIKDGVPYEYITGERFATGVDGIINRWRDNDITNPGTRIRYTVRVYWTNPPDYASGNFSDGLPGAVSAHRDVTPPGPAPTTPVRGALSQTEVTLTWNLANNVNNAGVNGFLITKMVGSTVVDRVKVARTVSGLNGHTWKDTNLNPGVAVNYRVQSLWDYENAVIDPLTKAVAGGKPGLLSGTRAVNPTGGIAPAGVRGTVNSPTQMTVTWNAITGANATGLLRFNVYLFDTLRNEFVESAPRQVLPTALRSVVFNNLNPNTLYQVRVVGVWDYPTDTAEPREGRQTAVNVRTTGPAPGTPRVASNGLTSTSARLMWNAVTHHGVAGYRVTRTVNDPLIPVNQRIAEVVAEITTAQYIANGNGWTDNDLRPGIQVTYTVQALWDVNGTKMPGIASARLNVTPLRS